MKPHVAVIKMVNKYNDLPEVEKHEKFQVLVNWLEQLHWTKVKVVNDIFKEFDKHYYMVFVGKDGLEHGLAVSVSTKTKEVEFGWMQINWETNKVKF